MLGITAVTGPGFDNGNTDMGAGDAGIGLVITDDAGGNVVVWVLAGGGDGGGRVWCWG